jgi:iron complex transport system permease protein
MRPARFCAALAAALATLLLLVLWSFTAGSFVIAPGDIVRAVAGALGGGASGLAPNVDAVVTQVRAPRIVAALAVGAALAAAGATFQSLFRNPLVSPDILGVTAGCALGAGLAVLLALPAGAVQAFAFVGGIAAVGLVMVLGTWIGGRDPILTLILTGVVVGGLFGAGVAMVKLVADPHDQLPAITFWLLGSFAGATPADVRAAAPALLAGAAAIVLLRWRMDVMSLPEDEARSLGVHAAGLRIAVIGAATLLTAAAVSLAGAIGWVGLVIPHAARLLAGASFARVLPLSLLLGAGFMLAVDTLCRTAFATEVPPGVATAFVGTPAFVALLYVTFRRSA